MKPLSKLFYALSLSGLLLSTAIPALANTPENNEDQQPKTINKLPYKIVEQDYHVAQMHSYLKNELVLSISSPEYDDIKIAPQTLKRIGQYLYDRNIPFKALYINNALEDSKGNDAAPEHGQIRLFAGGEEISAIPMSFDITKWQNPDVQVLNQTQQNYQEYKRQTALIARTQQPPKQAIP